MPSNMKNIEFKDVPYFGTFYLYGIEYVKTSDTHCTWVEENMSVVCDPDNLVEVRE
jgi:hypothetical protein